MTPPIESIGLAGVAISAIGLAGLIVKKHFEDSKETRKLNREMLKILSELKTYLMGLNGHHKKEGDRHE